MTDSHNQARLPALDETTSDEVLVRAAQGGRAAEGAVYVAGLEQPRGGPRGRIPAGVRRAHLRTSSSSMPSRAAVTSIHRRSASRWNRP